MISRALMPVARYAMKNPFRFARQIKAGVGIGKTLMKGRYKPKGPHMLDQREGKVGISKDSSRVYGGLYGGTVKKRRTGLTKRKRNKWVRKEKSLTKLEKMVDGEYIFSASVKASETNSVGTSEYLSNHAGYKPQYQYHMMPVISQKAVDGIMTKLWGENLVDGARISGNVTMHPTGGLYSNEHLMWHGVAFSGKFVNPLPTTMFVDMHTIYAPPTWMENGTTGVSPGANFLATFNPYTMDIRECLTVHREVKPLKKKTYIIPPMNNLNYYEFVSYKKTMRSMLYNVHDHGFTSVDDKKVDPRYSNDRLTVIPYIFFVFRHEMVIVDQTITNADKSTSAVHALRYCEPKGILQFTMTIKHYMYIPRQINLQLPKFCNHTKLMIEGQETAQNIGTDKMDCRSELVPTKYEPTFT
ncbi:MAG: putative capsid protein [Cressdnaviricota sp.]|nr:MAG: putative capsid protein [Cressdnaviricota sp.]